MNSHYDSFLNKHLINRYIRVYNPYIRPNENNKQTEFNTLINTNISDYSVEDIFNLLDITIEENSDYDNIIQEINTK